jgi:hypothetical protein
MVMNPLPPLLRDVEEWRVRAAVRASRAGTTVVGELRELFGGHVSGVRAEQPELTPSAAVDEVALREPALVAALADESRRVRIRETEGTR